MRTVVAFFALVFSIVVILLIQRDAGLNLARLLPLHGKWPGLVPAFARVAIILITIWGLSRLRRANAGSDETAGEPSNDPASDWHDYDSQADESGEDE